MPIKVNKEKGTFSITELTFPELVELSNAIDSCTLPQKRNFYRLKQDIDEALRVCNTQAKKNIYG